MLASYQPISRISRIAELTDKLISAQLSHLLERNDFCHLSKRVTAEAALEKKNPARLVETP